MRIVPVFLLLAIPAILPAAPAREHEPFEEAVDSGVAYLAKSQTRAGGWSPEFVAERGQAGDPAVTALAVMAFLSAGHVPGEGKYGPVVERGIRFVLDAQQPSGLLARPDAGYTEMYSHGICTLMLAEAAGMTDERTADELRGKLERAVRVILKAQRETKSDTGGWRYRVVVHPDDPPPAADLSVTGWQLMALRAARNVGCDVPQSAVKAAVEYVRRCHDPKAGGYTYTVGGNVTPACTGAGILSLELAGKEHHRTHEALRAGSYLLQHQPEVDKPHFFYGMYYTSQAMFQLGDNYWAEYRPRLHGLLLKANPPRANGAWYGKGADDAQYGPYYATAMAILALTVEYRFLPIYQREEREGGK
jgi:hypothetical protein